MNSLLKLRFPFTLLLCIVSHIFCGICFVITITGHRFNLLKISLGMLVTPFDMKEKKTFTKFNSIMFLVYDSVPFDIVVYGLCCPYVKTSLRLSSFSRSVIGFDIIH